MKFLSCLIAFASMALEAAATDQDRVTRNVVVRGGKAHARVLGGDHADEDKPRKQTKSKAPKGSKKTKAPTPSSGGLTAKELERQALCLATGGKKQMESCCKGNEAFINSCAIGACGCSPNNSEDVLVCDCPRDTCFDEEFGCVDSDNRQICLDTDGELNERKTCFGGQFPTSCLATDNSGGPFSCSPDSSENTVVCDCLNNSCFVKGVGCVDSDEAGICLATDGYIEKVFACSGAKDFDSTCQPKDSVGGGPFGCSPSSKDEQIAYCECSSSDCYVNGVGCVNNKKAGKCLKDEGEVIVEQCCEGTGAFADICPGASTNFEGVCECLSRDSEDTVICECPYDRCWNGDKCRKIDNY